MAKKRSRRKKRIPGRSRNSVKSTKTPKAGATGPVTLAQARALAKVSTPGERDATFASLAAVGLARHRLERKQRHQRRQRIKDYKATLAIMKKRGVKGLRRRAVKGGRAPKLAFKQAFKPLQVFAEGDSWFDYPVPFFGGAIIPRLENELGVPILNLAKAGDQARYMLGVKERKILIEQFTNGCPAGGPWDAMLFSGGGNDIVDDPMVLWIKDFNATLPPAALIHQARLDMALGLVRTAYEDLIELRDSLSPQTRLFFHGYDFVIPDGRGVCFFGPWLKPTFDLRGFPTQASRFAVMTILLQQFDAMLQSLASAHANVTVINTQGTLNPVPSSWHNELHPSKNGFDTFATLFHQALKTAFPTQVL
jgi:hypothetical protein